jgi:Pvc16 N-terminal domain
MSNTLAVAAVTSTMRYLLNEALGGSQPGPVGGANVTTVHPREISTGTTTNGEVPKGINVFLYQVTANHAWNLTDLPTRSVDGALLRRPVCALDLHYLLTCYGDDEELDSQRLLARALLALAVNPVLGRDLVRRALEEYADDARTAFLEYADLADQVELVKLSPGVLSLEELSRLWGVLGTTYLLSQPYTATVVLLEADIAPRVALPVRQRNLTVAPAVPVRLVSAEPDPPGPLVTGGALELRGSGLAGPGTAVRIGPAELAPDGVAAPDHVRVVVTEAVPAGVHAVQVVHHVPGSGGAPVRVTGSSVLPVLLRPRVAVDPLLSTATTVVLTATPALFPGQRAMVGLTRIGPDVEGEPSAVSFELAPVPKGSPPSGRVELDRSRISDGSWLIRLSVDGAESLPELVGDIYAAPALVQP